MREKVTPVEADTLDAVCREGSLKGASNALGVTVYTASARIGRAKRKLGFHGQDLRLYLHWDRETRGQA